MADTPHHLCRQRRSWQARPGALVRSCLALETIGVAFALVGLLFMLYAYVRQKRVEEALARGEYAPFQTRMGLVFTLLGVLLGIGTVAVILAQPA